VSYIVGFAIFTISAGTRRAVEAAHSLTNAVDFVTIDIVMHLWSSCNKCTIHLMMMMMKMMQREVSINQSINQSIYIAP